MKTTNRTSQASQIELPEIRAPSTQDMALRYANFVGRALFCDLREPEDLRGCCGTFIIVYTKPVRSIDDLQDGELELFSVGMGRKVEVRYTGTGGNPRATQSNDDDFQSWATATITCGGQECELELEAAYPGDPRRVYATAGTTNMHYEATGRLEQVLQLGLQDSHHSIRFGEKVIGREEVEKGLMVYGFQFIEMKLKCFSLESGEDDTQLVIAVKIPDHGDVSSVLLLKQVL